MQNEKDPILEHIVGHFTLKCDESVIDNSPTNGYVLVEKMRQLNSEGSSRFIHDNLKNKDENEGTNNQLKTTTKLYPLINIQGDQDVDPLTPTPDSSDHQSNFAQSKFTFYTSALGDQMEEAENSKKNMETPTIADLKTSKILDSVSYKNSIDNIIDKNIFYHN